MRYRLRTLLILLAIGPPVLAWAYVGCWAIRPDETAPTILFSLQDGPCRSIPQRTADSPQAASLSRPKLMTYDPSLSGMNGQMVLVQEKQERPYEPAVVEAWKQAWKRQGMWPIYFTDGSKLKD